MTSPQHRASDPVASVFVTANAGSGKTTTLVSRVARLLLQGAPPEAILCVTYTKAAAAEMQRRLFQVLGDWSTMEDDALKGRLGELEGGPERVFDAAALSRARALFARALETPGGLKIQTIHAFCEKLLRRFPLEADVSPGFTVMDDAAAAEIAGEARAEVAKFALRGEGAVADAYARMSVALAYDDFQSMFLAFESERAAIAAYVDRIGGPGAVKADVWARCGFDEPLDGAALESAAIAPGLLDRGLWRACAEALIATGKTADGKCAQALAGVAELIGDPALTLDRVLGALFTERGQGTPAVWVAKTAAFAGREDLRARLMAEQDRLEAVREQVRAAKVAQDTVHALTLAFTYVDAYRLSKAARGALDFADLIIKTCELLTERADAAWVLYKLDGGVDHVLLDEAQDTAPEQWAILRAITAEFFAGFGAQPVLRGLERTLFIVGDEKQSIYSFQGAAPHLLIEERNVHLAAIAAAGREGRLVPLIASFRSTPEVLGFVDALFSDRDVWTGVPPSEGTAVLTHIANRKGHPGCVEVWPLVQEEKGDDREAWTDPVDQSGPQSANRRLAEAIAAEIQAIIARGDAVYEKDDRRPAHYGDVLILVRRRRALFEETLRALKRRGVPVAGADRLRLSEHIAFDDLMALGRLVQFPGDDLTLAALLRSPFCDVDEDSLFALAHGRRGTLWAALQARADERPDWAAARTLLEAARQEGRTRRPFDFYARFLGQTDAAGRSMRARVLTRLGAEAEDVLDEFLAQVIAAERTGVHDLERLVAAFASLDITVKREMEGPRGEVRVMTVHGAKGLEAPIVILPETTLTRTARGSPLMRTQDGGYLWCSAAKTDAPASAAARTWRERKEEEETQRLLYVALTRARDRLILAGRVAANAKPESVGGWYAAAQAALAHPDIAPRVREVQLGAMVVRRFGPDPATLTRIGSRPAVIATLPGWAVAAAPPEPSAMRWAAPSALAEAERGPAPSPLATVGGLGRFRRGELIHRLLQLLPDIDAPDRAEAAGRLLARERDLTDAQRAEMADAALTVLRDDRFAAVFGPGSRAEVALAGAAPDLPAGLAVSGRVDRLLVEPGRVLVVDFKTNRPSPERIEDADPAYLRQMAVYAAVLRAVFPGRSVEAALVWTDGPKLMPVPENIMAAALAALAQGG